MKQVIYVAALTFHRPEGLARLLSALSLQERPDDAEVRFLIVDNDAAGSARPTVDAARPRFGPARLDYVIESEPGIPMGRNCALNEAIASGGDLLCFTDDDAWPDPRWLRTLVDCYRESGAVLVFGPHFLLPLAVTESLWKRFLARSLAAKSKFIARFAAWHGRRGRIVTSGTYNCLINLKWIQHHDVEFDPSFAKGGGEDSAFREVAAGKGAKLAWSPGAVVYEELPLERISLRYQFQRSRMQGINASALNRPGRPAILRHPIGRLLVGIGLIIVPVLGTASFSLGLHMVGMAVGIFQTKRAQ